MSVYVYTWLDVEEGIVKELLLVLGAGETHMSVSSRASGLPLARASFTHTDRHVPISNSEVSHSSRPLHASSLLSAQLHSFLQLFPSPPPRPVSLP